MRILFICKKNECYGFKCYTRRSSGLYNSTRFIIEGLVENGIEAKIVEVVDNNCIDREVTEYRPDVVIIEALWVVPEKFPELMQLHPNVRWYVHLHSHMPFLALEGIAMDWIIRCAALGVGLIANSKESYEALRCILTDDQIQYLPNVYRSTPRRAVLEDGDSIDVGCFGAVRPMKNHLLQALAAIQFAKEKKKYLRFHINASRIETGGEPVMKNLVQLFDEVPNAELVRCDWMDPDWFLARLQNEMDIGLQVSMTETFNVVNADYVTAGIPSVVSKEVAWASRWNKAQDNSVKSIVRAMHRVWRKRWLVRWNQYLLKRHERKAIALWREVARDTAA